LNHNPSGASRFSSVAVVTPAVDRLNQAML
jgi:hypothetical protein